MPEEEPLNIADVSCPVCLSIEVEPVTMPCSHSICKTCFTDTVLIANKECPLCRTRIASWARRATREGTLVNQRLWERIQEAFPDEVARRLRGEDDTSVFEEDPYRHLSGPGEIREEYERALQREVQEYLRQRSAEELAGQELARRLAEEERLALEEQQRRELMDARLAGLLANLDDSALFNEAVLGASLRTPSLTANLATIQDAGTVEGETGTPSREMRSIAAQTLATLTCQQGTQTSDNEVDVPSVSDTNMPPVNEVVAPAERVHDNQLQRDLDLARRLQSQLNRTQRRPKAIVKSTYKLRERPNNSLSPVVSSYQLRKRSTGHHRDDSNHSFCVGCPSPSCS